MPPERTVWPSGVKTSPLIASVCPVKVIRGCPVAASQSRAVWSVLPEAMVRPSGLNATHVMRSVCPLITCKRPSGGKFPDPQRMIVVARDQPAAVGAERHAFHGPAVGQHGGALERAGTGRAGGIPHTDRLVDARRGDVAAVGAHGHGADLVAVPLERAKLLARASVPDAHRLVGGARDHRRAVGPVGERQHRAGVPPDHGELDAPDRASQTRSVRSRPAEAIRRPSGLKATARTSSVCPLRTSRGFCGSSRSQNLTVRS